MSSGQNISIRLFEGPNLIVPFAAAVAEFASPYGTALATDRAHALLGKIFNLSKPAPITFTGSEIDFPGLALALALTWQETDQPFGFASDISQSESGRFRIAVGFFNAARGRFALRAGIEIANAVFGLAENPSADISQVKQLFGRIGQLAHSSQYGAVSVAYIRAAKTGGLPVYQIAPGTNALSYGQGARSIRYAEAANEKDSITGHNLAQSKDHSNLLIKRLGFPGVEHDVVRSWPDAQRAAARLGTPLVVKPIDRNGAIGVTVGIENSSELETAVTTALRLSESGRALVERFVAGDEHRLSVFGGRMVRASRRVPAHIVGDGERTIAEIIAAENIRRRALKAKGEYLYELSIGDTAMVLLRKQGFKSQDRPPAGHHVRLAGTSNLKTGGHREDVTDIIHPDNVAMAEAVAQNFHLDAAGVDFITPDITRSWTETPCAIIEVNSNPGTGAEMANAVLREKFPNAEDGYIPSVLVVGGADNLADNIAERLTADGKRVGQTTATTTLLAGQKRFIGDAELPERILGLLLDAACEALVVSFTPQEISKYGLPHTKYSLAVIGNMEDLFPKVCRLIEGNADICHLSGLLDDRLLAALDAL